ncbi:ubiquitin-domain-containing protein [Mycena metata]|uniref:Ubiquitin-domain-containing protein n=1 Tax=Mycena metata TaxID=1033252 RepID=A0AAD7HBP0_9AGAR|nr:ubiquitin-domain-containing protein [Mycena metata]
MADQAEQAFIRVYISTLGTQRVVYNDDYQQPQENSLKKVPVLQIALPPPPRRASPSASTSATLKLTFKSLKPAATYELAVHPTDTIAAVKEALAALPNGPAVPAQRLLFKGKALADGKLVKEYPISDGDTVNLSLKAVPVPAPPSTTTDKDTIMTDAPPPKLTLDPPAAPPGQPRRHARIPSVVLSPSPSSETPPGGILSESKDITLTLDADEAMSMPTAELSTYHAALAEPEFWEKLLAFLGTSFTPTDAERAWEDFLRAAKNTLTASEIARIRDRVGVSGMAGT